ncbi:MAG: hypothetical protein ABFD77_01265 [Thermotogota bacterium]
MKKRLTWLLAASLAVCLFGLGASAQPAVVQHKGDLRIGSGQVMTIENVKYVQEGAIQIEYGGRLIVRHATLELPQEYDGHYPISVRGNGELEIIDAKIGGPEMKEIHVYDQGRIRFAGVSGDSVHPWLYGQSSATVEDSTLMGVHLAGSGQLVLRRSTVEIYIRIDVDARTPIVFRGLEAKYYDTLELPGADVAGAAPFRLTLDDTSVGGWAVKISQPNQDVTVEDSTLQYVEMKLDGVTGSIQGLRTGPQADWDSRELRLEGLVSRLRLQNTTLTTGWSVNLCGDQPIEFANCEVGILAVMDRVQLSLVDCTVRWMVEDNHAGSITFRRTWLSDYIYVGNSQAAWRGDVRFAKDYFEGGWNNSTIRRTHEVRVVDAQGKPVAGARVKVQEPGGGASREYTTDSEGRVEVEIKFTDKTCLSSWTFSLPGHTGQQAVMFFTATPIVLIRKTP